MTAEIADMITDRGWFNWAGSLRHRIATKRHRATGEKRLVDLHRTLQALIENTDSEASANLAVTLHGLWGDDLDPTRESFIRSCLSEFSRSEGNILTSSASLLTLILGAVSSGDKQRTVWCLEHDSHWINTLRAWIAQYAITGTYVIRAPVAVVGGMVRYQILTRHLPKNISLVVCERTGSAPGSTLSTLITVGPHLAPEFTIFARRVDILAEAPLIKRWAKKHGANFVVVDSQEGFIKLARRSHQRQEGRASYFSSEVAPTTEKTAMKVVA